MSYLQKHTFPTTPAIMRFIPVIANLADLNFVRKHSEVSTSAKQEFEKIQMRAQMSSSLEEGRFAALVEDVHQGKE